MERPQQVEQAIRSRRLPPSPLLGRTTTDKFQRGSFQLNFGRLQLESVLQPHVDLFLRRVTAFSGELLETAKEA